MRVLVTGLCSLQWGRMEHGNIGNYYIMVPLFRNLHRVFPGAEIITTLQLTDEFCEAECVKTMSLESYYGWVESDLDSALKDFASAYAFASETVCEGLSEYLQTVLSSDLVISFAGDMWGDNSEGMGPNRFLVDLLKTRSAMTMGKTVVLFASSPGPVTDSRYLDLARKVFSDFSLVVTREKNSRRILSEGGFDVSKTVHAACPAFLFDSSYYPQIVDVTSLRAAEGFDLSDALNVGFILATYSLPGSSFDSWERDDSDFSDYVELIEHMVVEKGQRVVLISHSNGFILPPNFKRTHWRDYKMICQLYDILKSRGIANMDLVHKVDQLYQPWEMHALIGQLDMLVSGRVHGAVAGLAQCIPTLAVDYKNGPLAHKMFGFFELAGVEEYVVPRECGNMISAYNKFNSDSNVTRERLQTTIPLVKQEAINGFDILADLMDPSNHEGLR